MRRQFTLRVGLLGLLCLGGATTARAQNVGIGTATPTTRLHVDGETRVGSTGLAAAAAGAGALRWNGTNLQYSDGTNWVSLGAGTVTDVTASAPLASSGGSTPNISLTGIVPVANGGTGVNTIPANGLVFGNGTSPVGTTVPTAPNTILLWTGAAYNWAPVPIEGRDIDFNASAPGSVDIEPQLDFVHTVQTPAANNFLLQTQAGRDIIFNTNGPTERMRILANGRVGIGSINPNTQLDVVGGAAATETNLLTLRSNFIDPNTGTGIRFVNSTNAASAVGMGMMVRQMNTNGKSETVFNQHGGGTPYGALLERMRLSWIDAFDSPNLRIGTPAGNRGSLSLVGGTSNNFALNLLPNTGMTANNTYVFPPNTGTAGQLLRTDGAGNLTWSADVPANDNDYIWNQNAVTQTANFRISGTGRTDGNMFISMDNTTGGGLVLADDGDFVDMNDGYGTFRFTNGLRVTNANRAGSVTSQISGTASNPTYFNAGNNVGIGTATPAFRLEVARGGDVALRADASAPNDPGDLVFIDNAGNQRGRIWSSTAGPDGVLYFTGNNTLTQQMTLSNAGNLGIGAFPAADVRLDVFNRMRMRDGANGSAGSWYHNGGADRFFAGSQTNDLWGIYGVGINDWFVNFHRVTGRTRMRTNTSNLGTHNAAHLELANAGTGHAMLSFHNEGVWGAHLGLETMLHSDGNTRGALTTRGWSGDSWLGHTSLRVGELAWGISAQNVLTRDNAGLQGDAGARSGFFETVNPTNYYAGASSWQHLIDVRHSNPGNNFAMQIAGSFFDQRFFGRKTNNNPSQAWTEFITTNILNYTGEFCRNQNVEGVGTHNSTFSTSQYICFLTRITGRFEGGGELVNVGDWDGNGFWDIRINSAQAAVGGCMRCLQIRP